MNKDIAMLTACFSLFCASEVQAETLQGTTKGQTVARLSTEPGIRLLQSFDFQFQNDDHHLKTMAIVPNQTDRDELRIEFSDMNSDDPYSYRASFVPYLGPAYQNVVTKNGCTGSCILWLQTPSDLANQVFVLKGFSVSFTGTDHHLDELKIMEKDGKLTVAFNDKNDDDQFSVFVSYAYLPRSQFSAISAIHGAVSKRGWGRIDTGNAVVRGFSFDFRSEDHHMTRIAIDMPGDGSFQTFFHDKNGDDQFSYTVDFGVLL